MTKSCKEHIFLKDAVKNRNAERALDILRSHIDRKEGSHWSDATRDGTKKSV